MRYGTGIVRDDGETVQMRGWAYDVEANNKSSAEDDFKARASRSGFFEAVPAFFIGAQGLIAALHFVV